MITVTPIEIEGHTVIGVQVELPKTNLIAIRTEKGYIMCGALDVSLLNDKLADRGIIAGRAVGVRSLEDLLNFPLESITKKAEEIGIREGMSGKEALLRMI
ncbi:YunC family protein [Effusibacillus dendaii]|uniref:DUF1805 domain-containing protein n=1 Tax=Effusibacillus dendaii TaxID=2743772 RepID=A0A7I8D8Q1_9BACL|nr:DUF1805 domain-containing protein [Effusibacillus dendaii]BCJ86518.1 hypothetical protein skT53_15030 [Effusibacillus dendaii]